MNLEPIQSKIYELRGVRVMLDFDLAGIYGVETKRLKEQVRRNIKRFEGDDFMFELSIDESNMLAVSSRSQFATLNKGRGSNIKYQPFAFTELGVAMLSSVLKSDTAIETNKRIMRAFVAVRHLVLSMPNEAKIQQLASEVNDILQRQEKMDEFVYEELGKVYEAISHLAEQKKLQESTPRRRIGF